MKNWFQKRGFSPAQALSFVREAWCLSPVVFHPKYKQSSLQSFPGQILQRQREALFQIEHVSQWLAYQVQWESRLSGKQQHTLKDLQAAKISLSHSPLNLWRKSELQQRIFDWKNGVETEDNAQTATWEDVRRIIQSQEVQWLAHHSARFAPPQKTWIDKVETLCVEHGLHHLRLPIWHQNDFKLLEALQDKLETTNTLFKQAFGIREDLSLLGLRNHLGLNIGFEQKNKATCRIQGMGHSSIQLHPSHPGAWEAMGHEWFHAFDIWSGYKEGLLQLISEANPSKPSDTVLAWKQLFQQLTTLEINEDNNWLHAKKTLLYRFKASMPQAHEWIEQEYAAWKKDAWKENEALARWREHFQHEPFGDLKACMIVAEMTILKSQPLSKAPLWRQVAHQAEQYFPLCDTQKLDMDYLRLPSEILAHAFEAHLEMNQPTWVTSEQTLRYPSPTEKMAFETHWQVFTERLKPWILNQWGIGEPHPTPGQAIKTPQVNR